MALQTNLSKKDKMTIAIVLFAGLVFAISWFLIKPTATSIIELNDKIEQAEAKQDQYRKKIMNLSSGEALYGKSVNDLTESTSDLYAVMDSSEIDKMVTSYVLKSGLFSESLIINMPSGPVNEVPYKYSSLKDNQTNSVVTTDITDTTPTPTTALGLFSSSSNTNTIVDSLLTPYTKARADATSTESSGIQCVELTLVVTGNQSTCQAFIDDICTKSAVRITGFEWFKSDPVEKYNEKTGLIELVEPNTAKLKITVNLYMADIADYDIAVSD